MVPPLVLHGIRATRERSASHQSDGRGSAAVSKLPVVAVDAELVVDAIELAAGSHISLWDAQLVCAAVRADCATVFTEDLHKGQVIAGVTE